MKNHYRISSPVSRAIFSVFDTKVWEIFTQETRYGLLPKVWDSKPSTDLMLTRKDRKVSDCSALYVMTTTYFWPPIGSLLPTLWKNISLDLANTLLISHYKLIIWSLCCEDQPTACLSILGHLGVKRPIFARYFSPVAWETTISIPTREKPLFRLPYEIKCYD